MDQQKWDEPKKGYNTLAIRASWPFLLISEGRQKILFNSSNITLLFLSAFFLMIQTSCKKLVEVAPPITQVTGTNVYNTDATAIAVLTGIYSSMSQGSIYTGNSSLSLYAGLSADELSLYAGVPSSSVLTYYYKNSLYVNSTSAAGTEFWTPNYTFIFLCNSAIAGLTAANGLTPSVQQQLLGESYFMRAFYYFYLVNLYGDVAMPTTTNYVVNETLPRTPQAAVWQQIIADLKQAQNLLSTNYLDGTLLNTTTERVRPTKWAASALLARSYLYTGDFHNAELQADAVINNVSLYSLDTLNGVFLKNSTEAIWQLQPVNQGWNTADAQVFIIPPTGLDGVNYQVSLSNSLMAAFEMGDSRKANWIDSVTTNGVTYYYPYKYKSAIYGNPVTEYLMLLRLGEQYLIRAEAEVQLSDLTDGADDLNVIRSRANLSPISGTIAAGKSSLLGAIYHERQVELFTELGHRWLDLKRTNTVDAVMDAVTPLKANGSAWQSYQQLYPLPLADILQDKQLVQNLGY